MITNDDLLEWINQMPLWFRKAVVLYHHNNVITEADIKKLADLCLVDDSDYKVEGINLINHGDKEGFTIKSIDSVTGVNALASRKPLEFGKKGITVVYGLNGAGKSGYIRIFKMISGAKYREDIKNNIYESNIVSPMATITLTNETGKDVSYECDLKKPGEHKELRDIDIFDTKISNAYVNEAKEATYEPWIFGMLSTLAEVASRVRTELKSRENGYIIKDYSFPDNLIGTEQYKKILNISYKSKIEEFPSEWSDDEEEKLVELRTKSQLEMVQSKIKQLESEQRAIKSLHNYFVSFKEYFDQKQTFISLKNEWDKSVSEKKAAELLFSKNASNLDAESVGLDSWKKLWMYARQYTESNEYLSSNSILVKKGGKCPLCLQKIESEEEYKRISTIDAYVNGKVNEQEKIAKKAFESKIKMNCLIQSQEALSLLIESAGMNEREEDFYNVNNELQNYLDFISDSKEKYDGRIVDLSSILNLLDNKLSITNISIQELQQLMEVKEQSAIKSQLDSFEAQKALVENYSIIESNIASLKKKYNLQQAEKKTSTNRITAKSKELAQEMITAEYIKRFDAELKDLTQNDIQVKLSQQRGGSGRIPYKVVLNDASGKQISPQDILSEGENRVTALAAFFAESSGRSENTPLIVDDPISSLDYLYESKVINRLVKASLSRQVIVFTHRISMVVGIADKAKEYGVDYKEISLKSNKLVKGVPADYSDIGTKAKGQLNALIDQKLRKLKLMDDFSEEYNILFHNICQDFRNIVEKSVEDVLLNEVVKRFRKDIQTKNRLEKLADITIEDCQMFDRLMTRYSYYDHSMSDETPLIELSVDELEADLVELQTWIRNH